MVPVVPGTVVVVLVCVVPVPQDCVESCTPLMDKFEKLIDTPSLYTTAAQP